MSRARRIRLTAVLVGSFFALLDCQPLAERRGPVEGFEVNILTNGKYIRSRLGEVLAGYLAEYELNSQKHRIFISFELLRYGKGERLRLRGWFIEDSVRISFGDQIHAEVPVFHILRAEPGMVEKKMAQVTPSHRLF
jgi:hypothetical protein